MLQSHDLSGTFPEFLQRTIATLPHEEIWLQLAMPDGSVERWQFATGDENRVRGEVLPFEFAQSRGAVSYVTGHNHPRLKGQPPLPAFPSLQDVITSHLMLQQTSVSLTADYVITPDKAVYDFLHLARKSTALDAARAWDKAAGEVLPGGWDAWPKIRAGNYQTVASDLWPKLLMDVAGIAALLKVQAALTFEKRAE